jgi:GNAT superfamily N-acetyltransferase
MELLQSPEWPADELRDCSDVEARFLDPEPRGSLFLAHVAIVGDSVVGLIAAHVLRRSHASLVEYLAVAPAFRRRGIGTSLYQANRARARERGASKLLVEFDSPSGLSEEGRERWRWYERLGVYRVDAKYWQPPYRRTDGPKPMALGYDLRYAGLLCSAAQLCDTIAEMLQSVYGLVQDEPLAAMIRSEVIAMPPRWLVDTRGGRPVA